MLPDVTNGWLRACLDGAPFRERKGRGRVALDGDVGMLAAQKQKGRPHRQAKHGTTGEPERAPIAGPLRHESSDSTQALLPRFTHVQSLARLAVYLTRFAAFPTGLRIAMPTSAGRIHNGRRSR